MKTVYVQVPKETPPKINEVVDVILKNGKIISGVYFEGEDGYYDNEMDRYYRENVVAWLEKREEQVVMSKEEFDKIQQPNICEGCDWRRTADSRIVTARN